MHDEGEESGLLKGQRKTLLKQLGNKFGPLPEAVVARIHAADEVQLDLWAERVLTATTLGDVLGRRSQTKQGQRC